MRVLVLGTSGVQKRPYIENVADIAADEAGYGGLDSPAFGQFIRIYDLDERIREVEGGLPGYTSWLSNVAGHEEDIRNELSNVLNEVGDYSPGPPHIFLLLHTVYYRKRNFFSALSYDMIDEFNPTVAISLIDDFYDVSASIREREQEIRTESAMSHGEVLQWRNVELMMTDFLTSQLPSVEKHFVVAKKHPPEMVRRLLFERNRLRLYSAYPMRNTRTTSDRIRELNSYRERLGEEFTVFDPATIDERPIMSRNTVDGEDYIVDQVDSEVLLKRQPVAYDRSEPAELEAYPPDVSIHDFLEHVETIDQSIERRDFRLIDQSDAMIGYRPNWSGEGVSSGVSSEADHARRTNTPAYVVHKEEDGQRAEGPFRMSATYHETLDGLIDDLSAWQEGRDSVEQTWDGGR